MFQKSTVIKLGIILLIEIIMLSLFFTGLIFIPPKISNNSNYEKSVRISNEVLDLETSKNYVYVASTNNSTSKIANITKYDSNLHFEESYNFNYNNFSHLDILAATDQSILVGDSNSLEIVNTQGSSVIFYNFKEANGSAYLKPLAMRSSFFIAYVHRIDNTTNSVDGYKLNTDGSKSLLFHIQINATYFSNPFYRNSNIIEIASTSYTQKDVAITNSSIPIPYFDFVNFTRLQYNIKTNSIQIIPSTIDVKVNQMQDNYYAKLKNLKQYSSPSFDIFPFNNEYAIYEQVTENHERTLQILTSNGNNAKYTTNLNVNRPYPILIPAYSAYNFLYPGFQIENRLFLPINFLINSNGVGLGILIYSQYTFNSKLNFYNFSLSLLKGYKFAYKYMKMLQNNILYFAYEIPKDNQGTGIFIMKLFNLAQTIFDFIYLLPLPMKIMIEMIVLVLTLFYFIKKLKHNISSNEIYPTN